ncbi:MAG: tRNA pseudouridine(13) synthase TruD [Nitrososphaerota archaeon]|nr:tRNA pseudouridine(13) synthase TruD [Nitrososphaerota archaeon]MDG7049325.1 tRNA pseudouridine(13) synthase TruD [Nitrososphaerota archaeon]MDG7051965.1 tRNA pseudouridine(13) synthase TruD [Nitrososphaerota archaeon]
MAAFEDYGITQRRINYRLTSGIIKEYYEDFIVCEILKKGIKFSAHGHPLLRIKKRGVGHVELVRSLPNANLFGIKDKISIAYQFASMKSRRPPIDFSRDGLEVSTVGFTAEALGRGQLLGNAFGIRIRQWKGDDEAVREWERLLLKGLMPNYFGPQRFGGNNIRIGMDIVRRNFKAAEDSLNDDGYRNIRDVPLWLRRLLVQSYQSYLFNRSLSKVVDEGIKGKVINVAMDEGPFKGYISMAPLVGYSFRAKDDIYSKALVAELEKEGLRARDFYIDEYPELSVEGGYRPAAIISAKAYHVTEEDSLLVGFLLHRGSYATSALQELLDHQRTLESR